MVFLSQFLPAIYGADRRYLELSFDSEDLGSKFENLTLSQAEDMPHTEITNPESDSRKLQLFIGETQSENGFSPIFSKKAAYAVVKSYLDGVLDWIRHFGIENVNETNFTAKKKELIDSISSLLDKYVELKSTFATQMQENYQNFVIAINGFLKQFAENLNSLIYPCRGTADLKQIADRALLASEFNFQNEQ